MHLDPGSYPASGIVQASRRVFIATRVQITQLPSQPAQIAELFEAEVCLSKLRVALLSICRFNQTFQDVESRALHPVSQHEFLTSGEAFENREQPQNKAIVGFKRGPGLASRVSSSFLSVFSRRMMLFGVHKSRLSDWSGVGEPFRIRPKWQGKLIDQGLRPWTAQEVKR